MVRSLYNRTYGIDNKSNPVIADPVIAIWIKYEFKNINKTEFEVLIKDNIDYYLKICIFYYINNFKDNFIPEELFNKLNLFGEYSNYETIFTFEEGLKLIKKCIEQKKIIMACELIERGIILSLEYCIELGEYGILLYSIFEAIKKRY